MNQKCETRSCGQRGMRRGAAQKLGRDRKASGFLIVAYATLIFVIMGFAGLAVDVGYLQYQKRKIQSAADAAAMGALREMERNKTDLTTAGRNDSALNGFTNGQNGVTVTISSPPTSGTFSGDTTAISATVSKPVGTYFMRIFNQNSVSISATSVARTSTTEGSVGGCIFALNSSASGALTINGNVIISSACGATVDSSNSSAFIMNGGSTFNLVNGAQVGVVGTCTTATPPVCNGWSLSNNASLTNSTTNSAESPVNIQNFGDPLADVAAPTNSGLVQRVSSGGMTVNPNTTQNLSPGIYCGGIWLKGTTNLAAGTYILAGGGLTISAQATVTNDAAGVVFYNTSSAGSGVYDWDCDHARTTDAGSFTLNGGASSNLSAPTSGSLAGMLFMDDRNIYGLTHTINGNSTSTFDGAQYFRNNYLKFAGTNQTGGFTYLVADTITITGNANLGNDHSTLASVNIVAPSSTGGGLVQ